MPIGLADRLIDTQRSSEHALATFQLVADVLARSELVLLDACFLYDQSGRVLTYELSPDNMRIKRLDRPDRPDDSDAHDAHDESFDKDLWRNGADAPTILAQWEWLHAQLVRRQAAEERLAESGSDG